MLGCSVFAKGECAFINMGMCCIWVSVI